MLLSYKNSQFHTCFV